MKEKPNKIKKRKKSIEYEEYDMDNTMHYKSVDNPEFVGYSADIKKHIRLVFWLCFLIFGVLSIYICKVIVVDGNEIAANPYNPRLQISENIKRGDIKDADGNILATTTVTSGGALTREYPEGSVFSHVVGYSSNGKSGIEAKYNFVLETINHEAFQQFWKILSDEPVEGNSVVTTLDTGIQQVANQSLNGQKGAVVVMEPSTGKILAMSSFPDFDPNAVSSEWESLINDEENSPLLNRATQGLYPPGSVFKVVTAAAAYEYLPDYSSFTYNCQGVEYFGNNRIRCFDSTAHGDVVIAEAFAESCNTYFATTGLKIGGANMRQTAEKLYFNQAYPLELEYSQSQFVLDENSLDDEIIQTSIGQGETLVTPMHMAMITSAVANEGVMMKPYVVDHVETSSGRIKDQKTPEILSQVFTFEEAQFLENMMVATVESGTGQLAQISGVSVAGKTGTAENETGVDHGWFIAYAPAENPTVAVSVIVENAGRSKNAIDIAREVMEYAINHS